MTACSDRGKAMQLYLKGKDAYMKNDLQQAEALFKKAVKEDKSLLNAKLMVAKINYYRKDFEKTLSIAGEIIDKEPNHIGALFWKARTLVIKPGDAAASKKNETEAMLYLQKIIELDSHHLEARNLLALLYEKNKMFKEALYEYHAALAEEESLINSRANLSILYYRLGLKDKAQAEIERAISIAEIAGVNSKNLISIKKEVQQ